jgi:hypothetical protein
MLVNDLLKDLAFPDAVRHLQLQPTARDSSTVAGTPDNTTEAGSGSGSNNLVGIYILGLVMILVLVRIAWIVVPTRRANTTDASELPSSDDKTLGKKPKSTLAQRKQAILELFETSQVTMVSNDTVMTRPIRISNSRKRRKLTISKSVQRVTETDIHGEDGCIEDIESSGFDAEGILKLSRPVATSLNPTLDASSPLPPEWSDVPNMCAICLDSYQTGQVVAWSSGCRHTFHQDCISHYLAKKMIGGDAPCPSCRQKFCDLPDEQSLTFSSSSIASNDATTPESTEGDQPSYV